MSVKADSQIVIYRRYDDGYIVRSMKSSDAEIITNWWSAIVAVPRYDLEVALAIFPASTKGFYIGEYEGRVVASLVHLPWAENILYGSHYFVDESCRGRGFGTRMRDEVAIEDLGRRTLCIDAVLGSVAEKNERKCNYKPAFNSGTFQCVSKSSYRPTSSGQTVIGVHVSSLHIIFIH